MNSSLNPFWGSARWSPFSQWSLQAAIRAFTSVSIRFRLLFPRFRTLSWGSFPALTASLRLIMSSWFRPVLYRSSCFKMGNPGWPGLPSKSFKQPVSVLNRSFNCVSWGSFPAFTASLRLSASFWVRWVSHRASSSKLGNPGCSGPPNRSFRQPVRVPHHSVRHFSWGRFPALMVSLSFATTSPLGLCNSRQSKLWNILWSCPLKISLVSSSLPRHSFSFITSLCLARLSISALLNFAKFRQIFCVGRIFRNKSCENCVFSLSKSRYFVSAA